MITITNEDLSATQREILDLAKDEGVLRDRLLRPEYIIRAVTEPGKNHAFSRELERILRGSYWEHFAEWCRLMKARRQELHRQKDEAKRPTIHVSAADVSETVDEAEVAIGKLGGVYQQGGRIVHLVHHNREDNPCTEEGDSSADGTRRPHGALVVNPVSKTHLVELLSTAAKWFRFDARGKKWMPVSPPPVYAEYLIERGEWRKIPVLLGFVEASTLRGDGTIMEKPGYDPKSRLFLDTHGVEFPPVPQNPSRDDALDALALIKQVLGGFPFVPDLEGQWGGPSAARSVALSAILTGLVRRTLNTAPAHAIDAPTPGTGKTKLAEIASVLATGRTPTAISQGDTAEEFNKRLFSVLLAGDAVVIIDNIEQEVASDQFCTVLTSESLQGRILGRSMMATVPTNSLFLLTGNRIVFRGDIVARVVVAHLDARMENPTARVFNFEPVSYAMAHRTELVIAGLTVLRAHAIAGFPGAEGLSPSRFPDWDRVIRGALVWLGEPDPQATRNKLINLDPVRDTHAEVLRAWIDAIGVGESVTAQQVIDRIKAVDDDDEGKATTDRLLGAVGAALEGRNMTAKGLGKYLNRYAGRIYDGLSIHAMPNPKGASRFRLEVFDGDQPSKQEAGITEAERAALMDLFKSAFGMGVRV